MASLYQMFPQVSDILRLEQEELGAILLEIIPQVSQQGLFSVHSFTPESFPNGPPSSWQQARRQIKLAVAEAMGWLTSQGLIMRDPDQSGSYFGGLYTSVTHLRHTLLRSKPYTLGQGIDMQAKNQHPAGATIACDPCSPSTIEDRKMATFTAEKLSIMLGGGIFAVALVGFAAATAGATVPLAVEGASAALGMALGARVA
jgi:hypothetical protein